MVHRSLVLTRQIRSGVISFDFDVLHFVAEYPLQGHDGGLVTFNSDVRCLRWRDPMGISIKPRQGQIGMRKSMPPKWQGPCFSRSVQ